MKKITIAGLTCLSVNGIAAAQQPATLPPTVPVSQQAGGITTQQQPTATMTKEQLASQLDVKQFSSQMTKELAQLGTQFQAATQTAQKRIADTAALNADLQGKLKQLKDLATQRNAIDTVIKQTKADIASQRVAVRSKQGELKESLAASKQAGTATRKTLESYKKTLDTAISTGYLPTEQQALASKQQDEIKKLLEKTSEQDKQLTTLDKASAEESSKDQALEQELAKQAVLLGSSAS